jgi:hypothetical protein
METLPMKIEKLREDKPKSRRVFKKILNYPLKMSKA